MYVYCEITICRRNTDKNIKSCGTYVNNSDCNLGTMKLHYLNLKINNFHNL